MLKPSVYRWNSYSTSHHGVLVPWPWMFWGGCAGMIRVGISLSIGLFYSSANDVVCIVILISGVREACLAM